MKYDTKLIAVYPDFYQMVRNFNKLVARDSILSDTVLEYVDTQKILTSDVWYKNRFDRWEVYVNCSGVIYVRPYHLRCEEYSKKL